MTQSTVKVVCVTGGSGYIGSWLISLLLDREDENETKHLEALEGAETRLRLFQMDLLDYGSIVAAVSGVSGVFHVASPCTVDKVHDPEKELLAPAIKGTINVLTAAKKLGVKRVVITSSASAIAPSPTWPSNIPKSEDCWTDVEYCKQNELWYWLSKTLAETAAWDFAKDKGLYIVAVHPGLVMGTILPPTLNGSMQMFWYPLSKTLAEKAAWDFAEEKGLDIVVVNPVTVMGPIIPPTLNASMLMILRLIQGCTDTYENCFMCSVHVKDVALAHILVYENTSATGRHLCVGAITHYGDFAAKVAELYPEYNIPRLPKYTQPGLLRYKTASKKLMDLGLEFIPMEQIIKDSVEKDENETNHLEALEGAETRLRLFQMDLLDYESIVAAVSGVSGLFHVGSPCTVDKVHDPEQLRLVLHSRLISRRVRIAGLMLSIASKMSCIGGKSEELATGFLKWVGLTLWYPLSKTLAEKAAWDFAKEKGLDIVVVNPTTVMGPIIPPTPNASMLMILRLIQDVALAHILVYKNTSATGRHLCVGAITHYGDFAAKVAELYPGYNIPRLPKDTQPGLLRYKTASKKLMDLGLEFIPMEQIIKDSVESLKSKGFIS
ncbi:NAD(P)-binding Rossmann-fold superfamily protein [Artemisia annua]|uniref:Dihydroflavonol 4-reductase n=1 Tax=Artemisia annua TaxID=35608 RepID=A0A2U1LFR8_ARTAN|nr:NAD(P)-binding Rossmann-fold superfamily protein [Artemisia annua]